MPMIVPRRAHTPFDVFGPSAMQTLWRGPLMQQSQGVMRTDIQNNEDSIEMTIDLPGFDRENVSAELKDGMLTVTAHTESENEQTEGNFVRKERFSGRCSRSFFVGEDVEEDQITAKFDNGTLQISVPKREEQPQLEEKHTIAIEG